MTIDDLLKGRSEQAHREGDRERVLRLRWPFSERSAAVEVVVDAALGAETAPVKNGESTSEDEEALAGHS